MWIAAAMTTIALIIAKAIGADFSWAWVAAPLAGAAILATTATVITGLIFKPLIRAMLNNSR